MINLNSLDRPEASRLVHRVELEVAAGVEVSFAQYASYKQNQKSCDAVITGGVNHPRFLTAIGPPLRSVSRNKFKKWHGIRIPRSARYTRAKNAVKQIISGNERGIVSWNSIGNRELMCFSQVSNLPLIHYEHGTAWRPEGHKDNGYFDEIIGAIANSYAAERILNLRWGWRGRTEHVRYGVNNILSTQYARDSLPSDGPVKIGSAGRMIEFKGHRTVLHALKILRDSYNIDTKLLIAGTGELQDDFISEVARLNLKSHVEFKGSVSEMSDFYDEIDIMAVCSMREPFGRTSIEAQARGCPVLVTAIDGLPETLASGNNSNQIICPDWSINEYEKMFDCSVGKLPPWVYDPILDDLVKPKAVSPDRLAEAIRSLVENQSFYAAASLEGLQTVNKHFSSNDYGPSVDTAVNRLLADAPVNA